MAIPVLMPALSPTMTKGNLVKWHKKEGDELTSGMVLAEIETDKATMEVEVVDEGILAKILIPEGTDDVAVQSVIAIIAEDGEDPASIEIPQDTPAQATATENPEKEPEQTKQEQAQPASNNYNIHNGRIKASPLAKRVAKQNSIDLLAVSGTGPKGRIVHDDVLNAMQNKGSRTKQALSLEDKGFQDVPVSTMRKVIAERLSQSKQEAPHFYLQAVCDMDAIAKLRKDLQNSSFALKLSFNDFVVRATALALRDVPELNASWMDKHIRTFYDIHVAVAVSIPGGLVTPVVRHTDAKGLQSISKEIKDLAIAARDGKLKPSDYQGGTITVSNLGMYGVNSFQAIINPPQAAILAVGGIEDVPVVKNGSIVVGSRMNCTLSVDHRAVDGADAARWLQAFQTYIHTPALLLADQGL